MLTIIRFVFIFSLGWMGAVWAYDVKLPVASLKDFVHNKVENIKDFKFLGVPLFETPKEKKDISLPEELRP